MQDSIFTKIIKGEIPSYKIYEDKDNFAFLDIHPVREGHVLVVPKKQVEAWTDLDEQTYISLMQAAKKVAVHLKQVLNSPYIGLRIVGVDVPHVHIHLIPFSTIEEFNKPQDMSGEPDHDALAKMAARVKL